MISPARATTKPAPADTFALQDADSKSGRSAQFLRIVGERILRLSDTYRQIPESERFDRIDFRRGFADEIHAVSAVYFLCNRFDLFSDGERIVIGEW